MGGLRTNATMRLVRYMWSSTDWPEKPVPVVIAGGKDLVRWYDADRSPGWRRVIREGDAQVGETPPQADAG
ncbi:hypothetical protein GTS_25100 [Gandjariella thermophila]|uniref:Uncharacterized protein n=1 Tax=Gandjariella thermophila TaxID=1931992 RepID=A0A4D4JAB9_9PSEU|nr:hypothetical protein GTS_25100 [Gandjariella thermophila]